MNSLLLFFQISSGWMDIKGIMAVGACLQTIGSACCIFLLQKRTEGSSSFEMSKQISNQHDNSDNELTNQKADSYSANEKTHLTSKTCQDTPNLGKSPQSGSTRGWEILKMPDFSLFIVTFVFGCSVGNAVSGNIATYLRSFRLEEHLHVIMTIAPWFFLLAKVVGGTVSDLLIDKISRIWYWLIFTILAIIVYSLFIVYGENLIMMHIVAYFSFAFMGITLVICPVLTAEYFGVRYFSVNFGSIFLIQGCFTLLVQFVFGLLYDFKVTNVATHTCYGMQCFFVTSCLLCVLSIVTAITSVALCLRKRKVD